MTIKFTEGNNPLDWSGETDAPKAERLFYKGREVVFDDQERQTSYLLPFFPTWRQATHGSPVLPANRKVARDMRKVYRANKKRWQRAWRIFDQNCKARAATWCQRSEWATRAKHR